MADINVMKDIRMYYTGKLAKIIVSYSDPIYTFYCFSVKNSGREFCSEKRSLREIGITLDILMREHDMDNKNNRKTPSRYKLEYSPSKRKPIKSHLEKMKKTIEKHNKLIAERIRVAKSIDKLFPSEMVDIQYWEKTQTFSCNELK